MNLMRPQLPWLVALPLMVLGSLGAHLLSAGVSGARAESAGEGEHGADELALRAGAGFPSHAVQALGIVAALLCIAGLAWLIAAARDRPRRGASPLLFFALPPLAFSLQELFERVLSAEAAPFHAALEPRFLLGLAFQLPFGLLALASARLLLRVGRRIVRAFRRVGPVPAVLRAFLVRAPLSCELPRIAVLALGYPERGPPLP
jgi:hypothetical protein